VLGSLLQQPGRTTFDTKFDLTADPAAFLGRALHLWNPVSLGELQNQAYGYLFPQGPFFLGAQILELPDWLAQRLWSALLLVVAYEGVRRVCRALGISDVAAVLGGLCYALSPRLLGAVGVLSGEVLPEAVLPWVVLPLVLARRGTTSPRRAGLLSGVAVLFMSGVNATGTLAALPIALFVATSGIRRRQGRGLLGWWLVGAALASAWWFGPLLLLGRYSPPFLDFIETSAATTFPTGWADSVRGAVHWVAFYEVNGQAWWPGAHQLVTSAFLAVLASAVTAFGLVGLVHRRMPLRVPLTLSLVLGLLCLTVGNPSVVGSFVDEPVRTLLDGPLAALRNVHKVDPLVRLPLALGFAHSCTLTFRQAPLLLARRSFAGSAPAVRRLLGAALVTVLLAGATPLLTGGLRTPGWTQVPRAWTEAAEYLAHRPDSRALVVPGAGFGVQSWGWTIDEPLQGVAGQPWVTRSQVPLIPGQTARVLDAVEQRLASGQGSLGLSAVLRRAGITHVVLRRDLDQAIVETAAPDRVERALRNSPGLRLAAGFGRTGFGDQALIDVYAVAGASSRAALVDARDVGTLDGGPEDLLAVSDAGLLGASDPVIVESGSGPSDLVTDGYRRVERQFGRIHDAVGQVLTGSEHYRESRPEPDYPGAPTVARAVADYLGADDVRASSAQGYPDVFGPVLPSGGPAAAFDGRAETSWRSAPLETPEGQWLEVDLDRPVAGGVLQVSFGKASGTASVRRAAVSFDGDSRLYGVPGGGRLLVPVPTSPVHHVRISVVSVASNADQASPVAIAEVELPGASTGRTLAVPRPIGSTSTVVLTDEAPRRACVDVGYGPHCETSQIRTTEWNGLDRRLTMTEDGSWELSGTVVARAGAAAAALLGPVDDATATATSGSVLGEDPSVSAVFAFDGTAETPWLAEPGADQATLTLRWSGERTVRRLQIDAARVPADEPVRARIESSDGVRDVDLSDFGFFEPLRASGGLSVTFYRPASSRHPDLPLGVGEVRIVGLEGLQHQPSLQSRTGAACGLGPEVRIDGTTYRTSVTGTLDDVVAGRPLTWRTCDGPAHLDAGAHRLVAVPTPQFQPVSLVLHPEGQPIAPSARDEAGRMRITAWGSARRVISVSSGPSAILRIPENVNQGWRATLDGDPLEPVVLDGWQQGYRIPAGRAGDVVLEFAPDTWYRGMLLAGLVLAGVLVVLASVAGRRPGTRRGGIPHDLTSPPFTLGGVAALTLGVGGLLLGGIPLVVGWAAGLIGPIRRYAVPGGALAIVLSGVLVATSAGLSSGRPGAWADSAAALGVGLLLARVVRLRTARNGAPGGRP